MSNNNNYITVNDVNYKTVNECKNPPASLESPKNKSSLKELKNDAIYTKIMSGLLTNKNKRKHN
jgi:hypothetical protein